MNDWTNMTVEEDEIEKEETMIEKLTDFMAEHEMVAGLAVGTIFMVIIYTVLTPFMIVWKKLGLYDK